MRAIAASVACISALLVLSIGTGVAAEPKTPRKAGKAADRDPCENPPHGAAHGWLRRCPAAGSSSGVARGDFNCDGFADLAIGVHFEDIGTVADAGAVNVVYGSDDGLRAFDSQFFHEIAPAFLQSGAEANDAYGYALASGNFNGDSANGFPCSDLAIGIPGEDLLKSLLPLSTVVDAGAVEVLYGSPAGLTRTGSQFLFQGCCPAGPNGSVSVVGDLEASDRFGHSLTWGDFNGDGFGDLAVGVPYEDVDKIQDAGAVNVFFGSPTGLLHRITPGLTNPGQFVTQASVFSQSLGTGETPEPFDMFGSVLTAGNFNGDIRGDNNKAMDDLAIGVPREDVGAKSDAGIVHVLYGSFNVFPLGFTGPGFPFPAPQVWHQDTPFVREIAESSDRFGSALAAGNFNGDLFDDLAIGVPFEDNAASDAGAVAAIYGSGGGISATAVRDDQFITQNGVLGLGDIADQEEANDRFGWSLAAADFDSNGLDDLAVGVPFEDLEDQNRLCGSSVSHPDAGQVHAIHSWSAPSGTGLRPEFNRRLFQGGFSATDFPRYQYSNNLFGYSLTAWNFDGRPTDAFPDADLAVGVPGDGLAPSGDDPGCGLTPLPAPQISRAGAVEVLYSFLGVLKLDSDNNEKLSQQNIVSDGPEPGDQFGKALY